MRVTKTWDTQDVEGRARPVRTQSLMIAVIMLMSADNIAEMRKRSANERAGNEENIKSRVAAAIHAHDAVP